jgi:transposase
VRYVWLPPYCPELNPSERLWRDLKDDLASLPFPNLDAQQLYVGDVLQAYEASALHALTGDTYGVEAINALTS